ncbi:capsule biosynthesis protein [Pseudomonas sp. 1928-m]|uniref:capsule biosynthesis protein n=1 Tax=Pseudomonas sp. 1928-m TaxID=3033804 RepID=UPI0023DFA933|nr:capsule biosynthesis protein [Pseudomonas sp. 1928-m]MDF3193740.1 capsule biosynthesis protein [Pseudomonas sp. 1928-m]
MATANQTDIPTAGVWVAKARALDRYRWLMLRERHGLLGSAFRFGRDALFDLVFGVRAHLASPNRIVTADPCDFLLLQGALKVVPLQRKKRLIETLRSRGHHLVESALEEPDNIIAKRMLSLPPQPVPLRYFGYAAYAEWLVQRHDPRVLINDRNGSFFAPFLRLSLNQRHRPLVHLAHASTVESSRRLGMNDYDYYLLFGKSSEEALRRRSLRFGTSTLLLAGSHMIDSAFDLPAASDTLKTVLVLGVGPDKEKQACYLHNYQIVSDWAARHADRRVLIKGHPRSRVSFWKQAAQERENIEVLPADCPLEKALEQSAIAINFMSNAVIEAGLARRPAIYLNTCQEREIFEQERFFGSAVKSAVVLQERINLIEQNYQAHVTRAEEFACFHLAGGVQGLQRTVAVLEALVGGTELPADIEQSMLAAST